MKLRLATSADVPFLAQLYRHAVETLGPCHYTPAQVAVWAAFAEEPTFATFILTPTTFVAVAPDELRVGFAGLAADGHVTAVYVHGDYQHRGIGGQLLQHVLAEAQARSLPRLYAEASVFSQPLFEKYGFTLEGTETVDRNGVQFTRYLMAKSLRSGDSGGC